MTIPLRFNSHLLRNNRYHHRHITMLTTTMMMMMTAMMLVVALGDYPPSSEDSLGYYSNNGNSRGGAGGGGDGYISDWNSEWDNLGNPNPGKCINIPSDLTLCSNIGYTQMRLPNLLEHDTLKEVSQQSISWLRLLGLRCHQDTQIFLCSLFAPVCLERPIWPCRSLCESVQAGCESRMLTYGFPWPEMLRCNRFPADDDLCIGMRNDSQKGSPSSCSACLSDTFESAVDHYCSAEFVMRVKIKQAIVAGTDMKIDTEKKKKLLKTGPQLSSELRDSSLFLVQGSGCECSALDGSAGKARNDSNFIVMGSVAGGGGGGGGGGGERLVLSFVHRLDRASKNVTRALRVARQDDFCTKRANVLQAGSSSLSSSEGKKGKKGGGGGSGTKSGQKKAKGKTTTKTTGKEARIKKASTPTQTPTPTAAGRKPTTTTAPRARGAATTAAARRKTHQSGKTADSKPQQQQQKRKAATADPKRFY